MWDGHALRSFDALQVYGWIVQSSGHPDTKACSLTARQFFFKFHLAGRDVGHEKCKLGVISQERLKIEFKLLLSANMKSHMPHRLAQQRMTSIDHE